MDITVLLYFLFSRSCVPGVMDFSDYYFLFGRGQSLYCNRGLTVHWVNTKRTVQRSININKSSHLPRQSVSVVSSHMQVSLWMQRWQNRLCTWLHVSLSQLILRLYRPAGILSVGLYCSLLDPFGLGLALSLLS